MFSMGEVKYEDVIGRIQSLPKQELIARYKDKGSDAAKYLHSVLRLWQETHAQYSDNGLLLAPSV